MIENGLLADLLLVGILIVVIVIGGRVFMPKERGGKND